MINITREDRPDGAGILYFNGELTIRHAGEIKAALAKALENSANVALNLEKVAETDLSFLQLLCSAHRTAMNMNKPLAIAGFSRDHLKQASSEAGFLRSMGCTPEADKSCLWVTMKS